MLSKAGEQPQYHLGQDRLPRTSTTVTVLPVNPLRTKAWTSLSLANVAKPILTKATEKCTDQLTFSRMRIGFILYRF